MAWSYSDLERASLEAWQEDFDGRPRRRTVHAELVNSDSVGTIWVTNLPSTPTGVIVLMSMLNDLAAAARRLLIPDLELERVASVGEHVASDMNERQRDPEWPSVARAFALDVEDVVSSRISAHPDDYVARRLDGVRHLARRLEIDFASRRRLESADGVRDGVLAVVSGINRVLDDPHWWGPVGELRIERLSPGSLVGEISGASGEIAGAISKVAAIPREHRRAEDDNYHQRYMNTLDRLKTAYDAREALGPASDAILERLREELVLLSDQRLPDDALNRVAARTALPTASMAAATISVERGVEIRPRSVDREALPPREPPRALE